MRYFICFITALLLHLSIFLFPKSPEVEVALLDDQLIDVQLLNDDPPPKEVITPPKPLPPPPPPPPKEIIPDPPTEETPEEEELAEEEIIVPQKEIQPIAPPPPPLTPIVKVSKSAPTASSNTSMVMDANSLDNTNFKPFGNKKPIYPAFARKAGIEGWVIVKVLVNEKGKVLKAQVKKYVGHLSFKQSTLNVALRWRFPAPMSQKKRVKTWYTKKVGFILND